MIKLNKSSSHAWCMGSEATQNQAHPGLSSLCSLQLHWWTDYYFVYDLCDLPANTNNSAPSNGTKCKRLVFRQTDSPNMQNDMDWYLNTTMLTFCEFVNVAFESHSTRVKEIMCRSLKYQCEAWAVCQLYPPLKRTFNSTCWIPPEQK